MANTTQSPATKLPHQSGKGASIIEPGERTREAQLATVMGGLKPLEEQPPEQAGEHMDREKEARPTGAPALAIHERAAGNEAVDMRMMGECLSPSMKDGEETDLAAQVSRIGRNGLQRRRDRIEQDRIDDGLLWKTISAASPAS